MSVAKGKAMIAARHILIVDDETKVAFFLRESLEALGHNFQVVSVSSTEEALQETQRRKFDLIVTDQRMPDMDGLELIRQVQARDLDTQFILITAYGSEDVLAQARQLGAYRYFTKPFHIGDFVETVLDILQQDTNHQPQATLSDQHADLLSSRLEELRREIGAQCLLAVNAIEELVAQTGVTTDLEIKPLLRLVSSEFPISTSMMHYLGGNQPSNLNYYEGANHDIYTANVHENLFLVLVFDRRVQASRIGIVWLYVRRAVENLRRLMTLSTENKYDTPQNTQHAKALKPELCSIDQPH